PPPPACSKLLPPLPALLRRPGLLPRAVARVLRADKAPARRSAFAVLLKRLLVSVHIIGTVRRDVERRRRQRGDLRGKGTGLAGAGGTHRGQQGPDHAAGSGRHDNLVAVTLDPAVMLAVTPSRVGVHTGRHFALLAVLLVPRRSQPFQQAFIDRNDFRV